ncbi:gluconokinase [Streptomyces sp. JJ36]|uniref:gluconokinase n=1 Tax=Streptomyces sp. JJ36 TaxID=2736645 RepID=UPI001F20AEDC|nr:gluconokinase [Streptomyces sp. JJ36]MCF6526617.1 gluconokinase [Streptomyces sp. JJ36]
MSAPRVVVVMGVSGTGKSTVGALLADRLGVPYAEADAFHPPANIAKMSAGTPLDDGDRAPWLDAIGAWARERQRRGPGLVGVVSCSALRRRYRDRLRAAAPGLFFLHLTGDRSLVADRLAGRRDHFMPSALLDSQYATLEPLQDDEQGTALTITAEPGQLAGQAAAVLRRHSAPGGPGAAAHPAAG